MNIFIAIEGLLGAGKSTLSRELVSLMSERAVANDQPPWMLLEEPVKNNTILPLFYADPKKYAFALQIKMLHERFRLQQVAAHYSHTVVIDRSLPGDRCFAALHASPKYGNISQAEWEIYQECYDSMSAIRPPCTMIFLDIDPKLAMERIKFRARGMESGISLDYLIDLDREYRNLMAQIESGKHHWSRGIEVHRVAVGKDEGAGALAERVARDIIGAA